MAKTGKNLQQLREQQFDELIQKNWYYNDVYTYLLKFESEFTNLSLIDFILNCESATGNILMALLNQNNNKDLTIKYIIEQKGYYDRESKLNNFELYLTKFIVAHCLERYYKEDKKRTTFFNQMLVITKRNKEIFPQVYYHEYRIGLGWELSKYRIEEIPFFEDVKNIDLTTQHTLPQKEIEPIESQKLDWKKDERLIPYLIHLLNEKGFIKEKNQFAFIEKYFTVNGKPIKRENIKANYNQADYLDKPYSKNPKEIKELTDIIEQLNAIITAID